MIELDVSHFTVYKKEPKRDLLNAVFVAWLVSDFRQAQVRKDEVASLAMKVRRKGDADDEEESGALTGCEIRELPPERGLCTVGAFEGDQLVAKAVGRAEFTALRALVHGVLFVHSRKAPVERSTRDPSPRLPVAWWNAPCGEPGAGLPGLSQVNSSA